MGEWDLETASLELHSESMNRAEAAPVTGRIAVYIRNTEGWIEIWTPAYLD
jgi:hypothetical protein